MEQEKKVLSSFRNYSHFRGMVRFSTYGSFPRSFSSQFRHFVRITLMSELTSSFVHLFLSNGSIPLPEFFVERFGFWSWHLTLHAGAWNWSISFKSKNKNWAKADHSLSNLLKSNQSWKLLLIPFYLHAIYANTLDLSCHIKWQNTMYKKLLKRPKRDRGDLEIKKPLCTWH